MNEKALKFFFDRAQKENITQMDVKLSKQNDFTEYDTNFILTYIYIYTDESAELLDVGTGSGLIVNRLIDKAAFIEAIEPFEAYSQFITRSNKVHIVNTTVEEYTITKQFDLVLCFGFCHYLNAQEVSNFYKKFYHAVKPSGKIIVKNQFGVHEDVLINNFSKENNAMYYAEYRTVEHEKKLLTEAGFKNFEVVDIYPPECNRWDNTHFYAIVAEKE